MAFREPDYWNVSSDSLRRISGRLHQGNANALDHLPESEWPRVVHDFQKTLRFDSLRIDSVHFNVRKWRQRKEDMLKSFLIYPGNSRGSQGNRFHIKTKKPIIRYHVKPIDVMKKH